MTSESQKKATIKYMRENLDDIRFRVKRGKKEEYKKYAESHGKSLSSLIIELLDREMQKKDS